MLSEQALKEHIELVLFFGAIALLVNWLAWLKRFFTLPPEVSRKILPLPFYFVLSVFAIYLGTALLLTPLFEEILRMAVFFHHPSWALPIPTRGWLQLFAVSVTITLLFFFCKTQDRSLVKAIWKDRSRERTHSIKYDLCLGSLTWILGFPTVIAVGQLADFVVELLFGPQEFEQLAVRYLKNSLNSPELLVLALLTILVVAPIIEEFLFRGTLQNWLKRHLGMKASILLASLCFALFHLSASQGLGNISLAISLFVFALFLGFVYEKQGSLFASIGLHATFNAVSTLRILFAQE